MLYNIGYVVTLCLLALGPLWGISIFFMKKMNTYILNNTASFSGFVFYRKYIQGEWPSEHYPPVLFVTCLAYLFVLMAYGNLHEKLTFLEVVLGMTNLLAPWVGMASVAVGCIAVFFGAVPFASKLYLAWSKK